MHINAPLGDYSSLLHRSLSKIKIKIAKCYEMIFFCVLERIKGQTDFENHSFLEPPGIS